MATDAFVGPKIEGEPGGDKIDVKSGGEIAFASGSTFTFPTGATWTSVQIGRVTEGAACSSVTAGVASGVLERVMAPSAGVTIKSVVFIPAGTCAGHATSNFTLSLRNLGVGATGTTDIATLVLTTGNALALNVPKAFSVSATGAQTVAALESLAYYATLASLGIDVPKGRLLVEFIPVN